MTEDISYTVVIPAYNATAFIGETIQSVLDQTYLPLEIIVVDDGSEDQLEPVLAKFDYPIRLLRQNNTGPGGATSRGLSEVRTPLVATVDADDIWKTDKIEKQMAVLQNDPDVALVFTKMHSFQQGDTKAEAEASVAGWSRSTMMMRTSVFDVVGPSVDMPGGRGEMIDWLGRAREMGLRMTMLDEVLALRRIHVDSLSYGRDPNMDRGYLEAARRAILRRKAAASS